MMVNINLIPKELRLSCTKNNKLKIYLIYKVINIVKLHKKLYLCLQSSFSVDALLIMHSNIIDFLLFFHSVFYKSNIQI